MLMKSEGPASAPTTLDISGKISRLKEIYTFPLSPFEEPEMRI